ncbi:MAG: chorismate-binding protein [Bdellovibrionota bacterium]
MKTAFDEAAFSEFLKHGWCLGCGPDSILVGWGSATWVSDPIEGALYAPGFYLREPRPWLVSPKWSLIDRSSFSSLVLSKLTPEVNADLTAEPQGFRWVEPELSNFERQFEIIRQGFSARGLEKAVPLVHAQAREIVKPQRLKQILMRIAQPQENLIPYGFWSFEGDIREGMIGATPEILFSNRAGRADRQAARIDTMALAGTRAKSSGADAARALLTDPKERHEHQIVVDDIMVELSQFGDMDVGETAVVELPTLFHLKTPISIEFREDPQFEAVVRALHPTPALGVSPRSLSFTEIARWDDVKWRGRYGAPFGVFARDGDGQPLLECVVAIRNVRWHDDVIRLSAGCGIVPESQLEREWAELAEKRDSVKRILGV